MDDDIKLPENKDITYIGYSTYRDKNTLFGIKRKDRRQHVYILGKSGTGKSALMSNMVMQNILHNEGVCVVDPHGEFVEEILSIIPEDRISDVVYFNPADPDYHIGFNVLELEDPKYKHLVASGLMGIFTKIWANAWSARMEYILNNAILALLDTPGTTMLGIQRMLVDKDYRQKIISNLKDPVIKSFWVYEYEAWQDKFRNEAIAPIQNKVGQFLSTSIIRNVVGQSKSTINIFDIMNQGKIFLVNVSKGRIGEDNSSLLGGMLITKIQLAAMERVRIPEDDRKDFYLYVDEFQNFVTDSFASILSEARKYRLNLTVAHQYTAQLVTKQSSAMRDSIFGNVGTMIIFRVGADDADFLEKEFSPEFTPEDIVNLPNYKIYLKLMIDGVTSRPFSAKTMPSLVKIKNNNKEIVNRVIKSSNNLYAKEKEEVEKEINSWSGMSLGDIEVTKKEEFNGERYRTICSNCKNQTDVPFKPDKNRAVYCKNCIAKIKIGELKPIKASVNQLKEEEALYFDPLSKLGIEYEKLSPIKDTNKKPKLIKNIEKIFTKNKKEVNNTELKEVLNKALINEEITDLKEINNISDIEDKNEDEDSMQVFNLNDLNKIEEKNNIFTNRKNDRSAPTEDMISFKNFVEEKESELLNNIPKIEQTILKEEEREEEREEETKSASSISPFDDGVPDKPKEEEAKSVFDGSPLGDGTPGKPKEEEAKSVFDGSLKEEEAKSIFDGSPLGDGTPGKPKEEEAKSIFDGSPKEEDKNQVNIKEVPEEVLKKLLEEEKE